MRALLVFVLVAVAGCSNLNQQFVSSVDAACGQILPEYMSYVSHDAGLDDQSKAIRTRTAQLLRTLIDEAKKSAE